MSVYGIGMQQEVQTAAAKTSGNSKLNVEDFLSLMTAQLKNLDPLGENNSDPSEYISQMAQFTILEQINSLKESLDEISLLSQQQMSFSLVGKTVNVSDGSSETTGVVEKIKYKDGCAYPVIGGKEYSMSQVTEIGEE